MFWMFMFVIDPLTGYSNMLKPASYNTLKSCQQIVEVLRDDGLKRRPEFIYIGACVSNENVGKAFADFNSKTTSP